MTSNCREWPGTIPTFGWNANRLQLLAHNDDENRFRPAVATKFMQQILQTHLQHKVYNADEAQRMSKLIAEEVKAKLIGMLQGEAAAATHHTNARGIKNKGGRTTLGMHITKSLNFAEEGWGRHVYCNTKWSRRTSKHHRIIISTRTPTTKTTQEHGSRETWQRQYNKGSISNIRNLTSRIEGTQASRVIQRCFRESDNRNNISQGNYIRNRNANFNWRHDKRKQEYSAQINQCHASLI